VLLAHDEASRLDRVGNALAAWLGADALCAARDATRDWSSGARRARRASRRDGRHEFLAWRLHRMARARPARHARHGPLGLGSLAAHGHADALAITVFRSATRS
jgi:hypothetical protein